LREKSSRDLSKRAWTSIKIDRRRHLNRIIFISLCAVIALAPFFLGAVWPLAWDAVGLCVALLLIMSVVGAKDEEQIFTKYLLVPSFLFGVVVIFIIVQIMPWIPRAWDNPIWDLAVTALGRNVVGTIAADRQEALIGLFRLLSYAGIFYLAVLLCRDAARAYAAIKLVTISGSLYAVYGLVIFWSGNKTVMWFPKWAYRDDLTGTFVNRNSFATYLGLCTLAALCYLIKSFEHMRFEEYWRNRINGTIEFISARIVVIISIFALATALFLTHSRGGLVSTICGISVLAITMASNPSLKRLRRLGWIALPVAIFFIALFISGGATLNRLIGTDIDVEERLSVYRLTIQAITDYPWLGSGLNSFTFMFPIYRSPEIVKYYDLTHNDYLQNLLELGIPVALCLFTAILYLVAICMRGLRLRRRDAIFPCMGVAATFLVALHAMVDFSLQIPAVTYTYCFLLGTAVAQSWSSRQLSLERSSETDLTPPQK
jgi:O-antigen ligase